MTNTPPQVEVNEVGDVVVTEAAMMLALADQDRLALLTRLQRHGPAGIPDLAAELGVSEGVLGEQLELLAGVGLVHDGPDGWVAEGRGIFFDIPTDPEALDAARQLYAVMLLGSEDIPRRWADETVPQLELEWFQASGVFNAGVVLSPQELQDIQVKIEELMTPYTSRTAQDAPADGRRVRMLCYFLPGSATAGR